MKFYYEGKLVRTSKNHHYTHAVISGTGNVFTCSSSEELARKALNAHLSGYRTGIENNRRAIKAIEQGKTSYLVKEGRSNYPTKLRHTKEEYEEGIRHMQDTIEWITNTWKVIELEERE